jgi:dihydroorotate dehydrogenase electron transfer subunit
MNYKILINEQIAKNTYRMVLEGDTGKITRPGQFIAIEIDGFYLRRPISVCDVSASDITVVYKAVGEGTEKLSALPAGIYLNILTGLGNGYDLDVDTEKPLLIGGGAGVPPLYLLAKKLIEKGITPAVITGFNTRDEVFFENEFNALGIKSLVTTADGSLGAKGFVTDCLDRFEFDYVFACGPLPMLKAVYNAAQTGGQYSFEERMGCGVGACMGCTHKTKNGSKRICKDGPVLLKEEIIWQI